MFASGRFRRSYATGLKAPTPLASICCRLAKIRGLWVAERKQESLSNAVLASKEMRATSSILSSLTEFTLTDGRTELRLNAALRKARRWGITDVHITVEELTDRSDSRLFYCTRQSHHCLNPLLPPPSPASQTYNLRPRGHVYSLPTVKSTSFMKGFINRALFNFKWF